MIYTLTKLLSEEPEKREASVITLLKLIITLAVVLQFMHVKVNYEQLANGVLPEEFGIFSVLKFIGVFILSWYALWWLLSNVITGMVRLFSLIGKDKNSFLNLIDLVGVCKVKNKSITEPKKNVVDFFEIIQELDRNDEYPKVEDTRYDIYFSLLLYYTIIMLIAGQLPNVFIWTICFVLVNLFFGMIKLTKMFRYFKKSKREILNEFGYWNHIQLIRNAVNGQYGIEDYDVEIKPRKIFLIPKEGVQLPKIEIFPHYHWNERIGNTILSGMLKKGISQKRYTQDLQKHHLIISNFELAPTDLAESQIKGVTIVNAKSGNQIFSAIEEILFKYKFDEVNKRIAD